MATRKEQQNAAPSTAVAVRGPSSLAQRPDWLKENDVRGTENIGAGDIKPPALKLAQSTSDETKRTEAKYIEGLREGELFNSITKTIYGEGPFSIVIVQSLGHKHIEYAPRTEGGGVLDFNVPDGDPRTLFTTKVIDGKETRVKPRATLYRDYLVLLVHDDTNAELMTLSLKSTQLKKAIELNTILAGLKMPTFAVKFKVTLVTEKRGNDSFWGWKFDLDGYAPEAIYFEAEKAFEMVKGKDITVARDEKADLDDAPAADNIPF